MRNFHRHVVVLALAGTVTTVEAQIAVESPTASKDGTIVELLALKSKAQQGDLRSQVALGDFFNGRQQFTEAVIWYRHAATNGDVTAQLALAGCLIAGKGTSPNRIEAAHWMRLAADGVERAGLPKPAQAVAVPARTASIILTRSNAIADTSKSPSIPLQTLDSTKNLFTNAHSVSTRTMREDNLVAAEPRLQERSINIQPSAPPE